MSFKKEKRCPECESPEFWHRKEINIEFGYTGAVWGTAVTPGSGNFEEFTCAKCGAGDNYPRICGYFYPLSDPGHVMPNSSPTVGNPVLRLEEI
jgi:hypothetical protein